MQIDICVLEPELAALKFDVPEVSIHVGSITEIACDAVVSPANSFGFMDGNLDYAYSIRFGWIVQARLQAMLQELPFGELLVGQALVVPTGDAAIPYLISAPTMRVPKVIYDPADIMMATRAAVRAAQDFGLSHIAFPLMGTGCGAVPVRLAARAMAFGIEATLRPKPPPASWQDAQANHFAIGAAQEAAA